MKKLLLGALILGLSTPIIHAQVPANPRGETSVELSGGKVTVEYGRPSLKGRDINTLIYPGGDWRLGADGYTTLTTEVDLKFGDASVSKGSYVLRATFLGEEKWHLVIRDKNHSKVAEVPLTLEKQSSEVDRLTIRVEGQEKSGTFTVLWGKLSLTTGFTTP